MKIAILGAGRVGSSLARNLSNNNYEVSIVDESKTKIDLLQEKLDVGCAVGHAAPTIVVMGVRVLRKASVQYMFTSQLELA